MEKTDSKSVYLYFIVYCVRLLCLRVRVYIQMYIVYNNFLCVYIVCTGTYSKKPTAACTILGRRATWRIKTIIIIDHAYVL